MKKLLILLFICLALPIVLVKAPFLHEQNKEKPSTEKDSTSLSDKNETINEDKKEDAAAANAAAAAAAGGMGGMY